MKLRCRDAYLSLERALVMGVLNVTPDSFSDGGLWLDVDAAVGHGLEMIEQGAAIVDVGGESTRPGADPVPGEEELRRVVPVIEGLARAGVPVSIDTRKPEVAERAVAAGATILNDTLGEESDGALDSIAAETGSAIFVMHSRGTPQTMRSLTDYDDVVDDVARFLRMRARQLEAGGVAHDAIAIDPGFGFAKTANQSLELLRRLDVFVDGGYPVLVGTSRKSFMGALLGLEVDQRSEATVATMVWAAAKGARILRVHEVVPTVRAVRMLEEIRGAGGAAI